MGQRKRKTNVRHLLSLVEVGPDNLAHLIDRALAIASDPAAVPSLAGKTGGIYFKRTSTRTRSAFTVAAIKLGAVPIAYGPADLQILTGETISDTARVLSGYLDALVIRTNESIDEMRAFTSQDEMAVINAMSETEHPTQAVADLVTIKEKFGRLRGVEILYVGEGNNTAAALAFAVSLTPGMRLALATPEGYGLSSDVMETVRRLCRRSGSCVEQYHDLTTHGGAFDVINTTRWQTMGVAKPDPHWKEKFIPYRVTEGLMRHFSKNGTTIFMHDLPAVRGDDVVDEVLDGPYSLAFRQAKHKLTSAMAVLSWCLAAD